MYQRMIILAGVVLYSGIASAEVDPFDLKVCLAYSDRAGQLQCCTEFGIDETSCTAPKAQDTMTKTTTAPTPPAGDQFFYCKTRDLDGSAEDLHRWGRGTDFKFVQAKNIWEWRSSYSVMSIDSNGGFYEESLIPNVPDRIGECSPAIKWQYERRLEAIKRKFGG